MNAMNGRIIAFDFSGTLLKKDVAKEASNRRFAMLGKEVDQEWLEKSLVSNEHYTINNDIIAKDTGIKEKEKELRKKGYKIAIVSGIRTDIIQGMLEIVERKSMFDYILGQPPGLGVSNEELLRQLQEKGEVSFVIGDKINDINAGKAIKSTTVFVTWGHSTGEEEKKADFMVKHTNEILEIVQMKEKGD